MAEEVRFRGSVLAELFEEWQRDNTTSEDWLTIDSGDGDSDWDNFRFEYISEVLGGTQWHLGDDGTADTVVYIHDGYHLADDGTIELDKMHFSAKQYRITFRILGVYYGGGPYDLNSAEVVAGMLQRNNVVDYHSVRIDEIENGPIYGVCTECDNLMDDIRPSGLCATCDDFIVME